MKTDTIKEYLRLCDLHNAAFLEGKHDAADTYWERRFGFFIALESLGSVCMGDFVMTADRYVQAKFSGEIKTSAGFLLERPVLTDSQYAKLGPRQLDELGDDE